MEMDNNSNNNNNNNNKPNEKKQNPPTTNTTAIDGRPRRAAADPSQSKKQNVSSSSSSSRLNKDAKEFIPTTTSVSTGDGGRRRQQQQQQQRQQQQRQQRPRRRPRRRNKKEDVLRTDHSSPNDNRGEMTAASPDGEASRGPNRQRRQDDSRPNDPDKKPPPPRRRRNDNNRRPARSNVSNDNADEGTKSTTTNQNTEQRADVNIANNDDTAANNKPSRRRNQRRKKKTPPNTTSENTTTNNPQPTENNNPQPPSKNLKKPPKKNLWKKHLPPSSIDPISLEPLHSLPYPPFPLRISPPYTLLTFPSQQPAHLFDGRVLAYYLVSQLQFIDPLNRRDLTRDEIRHLDDYLTTHGLGHAGVAEAYEQHGVGVSRAGVEGQSREGRARILQEEARSVLVSLFGGGEGGERGREGDRAAGGGAFRSEFEREYLRRHGGGTGGDWDGDGDGDEEGGGMVIIDDDENPGLRAGLPPSAGISNRMAATSQPQPPNNRIIELYSRGPANLPTPDNFPSLPPPSEPQPPPPPASAPRSQPPPTNSSTLRTISSMVTKTNPQEIARQKAAREEAQRRAALSNLPFGATLPTETTLPTPPTTISIPTPVDLTAQLQRNERIATALSITPTTYHPNWARPTTCNTDPSLAVTYPDALLHSTHDKLPFLTKLERKFLTFLSDSTAPSLPLSPMDRPHRKIVHEYAVFWKLKTESYDYEPKRYVHCMKLRDTGRPYPLLSDVAWRYDAPGATRVESAVAVGVPREFPPTERRKLELLPKTLSVGDLPSMEEPPVGVGKSTPLPTNVRSEALVGDKQRNKLILNKRTIPPELPPWEGDRMRDVVAAATIDRTGEKQRERDRRKKEEMKLLEKAFASDESEGEDGDSESSSDWEVEEAVYKSEDDE